MAVTDSGASEWEFGPPTAVGRSGTIARSRLIDRLRAGRERPLVALIAPAGYGKTTLLAQWMDEDDRDVVWVTVDDRHNDPSYLVATIAAGIDRIQRLGEAALAPLASPHPQSAVVAVRRLCAELAGRDGVVIVLDDLHAVSSEDSLAVIGKLAQCLPVPFQLAVASREEPKIGIGRLRSHRAVVDLGPSDLAMTHAEAARLLRACGCDDAPEIVSSLLARTEGWPAALYLGSMRIDEPGDGESAAMRFSGDDRLVADYLREVFLAGLTAERIDFLIRVSILDRLSGDVCDSVVGTTGSARELRALSRSNLLIVPLDRNDHEFRLHPLLREMLRGELEAHGESEVAGLHRRASGWYADHGDIDRAIEHAIAARDLRLFGSLLEAVYAPYAGGGRVATLRRWLGCFRDAELSTVPELCTCAGLIALGDCNGPLTRRWAAVARRRIDQAPSLAGGELDLVAQLLEVLVEREGLDLTVERILAILETLPDGDPWHCLCLQVHGSIRHLMGATDEAALLLHRAAAGADGVVPSVQTQSLAQIALLKLEQGDTSSAHRNIHRALILLEHHGLEDYPPSALVHSVAALVSVRRGATRAASERFRTALETMPSSSPDEPWVPWFEAEQRVCLAQTALALGRVDDARELLAEGQGFSRHIPGATQLTDWITLVRDELQRSEAGDRWPLTPAEMRLLAWLPTHLSFPRIAEHLEVSTNTVKSQAQSIYRKLGVSSRAEAVVCARAAGLIADDPQVEVGAGKSSP